MKKIFIVLVVLFVNIGSAFSSGDGGYAGAFLRMGVEARSQALGDAFSAVPEGAIAGFYNPATLPHLENRQVLVSFSFLPLDRSINYIGFAMPIKPKNPNSESGKPLNAGLSVGWIHAGVDNIDGRDLSGNHTGYLSNSENAFFMSFAINPTPIFSFGLSGKVLYNRMPNMTEENEALTSSGFGLDLGAFVNPFSGLSLGLVIRDNMSKYTWNTDKVYERGTSTTYKFPRIMRCGAAYRIPQEWLLIVADLETSNVQNPRFHFGTELVYQKIGALRLGLDDNKMTFGFGLYIKLLNRNTTLNYTIMPGLDALAPDHIVSWAFTI